MVLKIGEIMQFYLHVLIEIDLKISADFIMANQSVTFSPQVKNESTNKSLVGIFNY